MNTITIIFYIIAAILLLVNNVLQAAALKSLAECRETDQRLIAAQRDVIRKQEEYIEILEEEAK